MKQVGFKSFVYTAVERVKILRSDMRMWWVPREVWMGYQKAFYGSILKNPGPQNRYMRKSFYHVFLTWPPRTISVFALTPADVDENREMTEPCFAAARPPPHPQ